MKMTDSGRTVYGGGGITPDVKIPQSEDATSFEDTLLREVRVLQLRQALRDQPQGQQAVSKWMMR